MAALLGFGAAYATQKEGAVGDSARAVGQVARTARLQAAAVNRKHGLVEKSKRLASDAWQTARDLDRRHGIIDQTVGFVQYTWRATTGFCQRHRVVERGIDGANQTLGWLAEQIDLNAATGGGGGGDDDAERRRQSQRRQSYC